MRVRRLRLTPPLDRPHRAIGVNGGGELRWDPHDGAPLDAVVASAQQLGVPHGFTVTPPEDATGSYLIAYWEDGDMEPNRKVGFGVLVIMIALGALFPLLGLSMLVILALEFLVIRRVPRLARIFGTEAVNQNHA